MQSTRKPSGLALVKLSAVALATAFSLGAAAQTAGAAASPGAGTSATGGRSAPAAQPGEGTRNAGSKKEVARGDRRFIEEVAGSGMFEVQVAQLATTRARSADVKSFASMLVDQHTKANDELTQLANAKGVELPAAPPRAMRREVEKLAKKNGDEFDQDFVKNVGIKAHEKDVKAFEKAGKDVKDPDLKAWVAKTLPTLKEHLAAAQKLPQAGGKGGAAHDTASMGNTGSAATSGNTGGGASTRTGGGNGANKSGS